MAEIRIFMATQQNKTVGIKLDMNVKTAKRFDATHTTINTRLSALEALVNQLESIEYDKLDSPVQLFINDHMVKNINNGYYKNWLLTGTTADGEQIEQVELDLWEKFHQAYCINNLYIILKSTSDAKLSESLLAKEGKKAKYGIVKISPVSKQNSKYSAFCWDKVKELVLSIDDINEIDIA